MLYIRTVDDRGRTILPEVLQQVVSIASSAIPLYTHGRFGLADIEQGTDTRTGRAGWITVEWTRDATEFCGTASVGREGGTIVLTYDQPGCSCGSQKIRPRTVKHELGHSMGLWHTGQKADLMAGLGSSECDSSMTARELQYLDYLYRRPVGNTDPDGDPSSGALLTSVHAID
jgi:predicted Zn-dependent protease